MKRWMWYASVIPALLWEMKDGNENCPETYRLDSLQYQCKTETRDLATKGKAGTELWL